MSLTGRDADNFYWPIGPHYIAQDVFSPAILVTSSQLSRELFEDRRFPSPLIATESSVYEL